MKYVNYNIKPISDIYEITAPASGPLLGSEANAILDHAMEVAEDKKLLPPGEYDFYVVVKECNDEIKYDILFSEDHGITYRLLIEDFQNYD